MSLYLQIDLPKNLSSEEVTRQKNIPCLCKVAEEFEIEFLDPLPGSTGVVQGWDWKLLHERVISGIGGLYTHYTFGMVTLEIAQPGIYKIIDLAMFDTSFGWCPVLENGEYGPPGKFYDEDDIG
ncbi:hypothetical protein [Pseudoduganella sp. R-34]|uniref:hypothetical protein n=2 Tax=Pseudoduganella TaxID=1522432 RepID=UPI003CF1EA1C